MCVGSQRGRVHRQCPASPPWAPHMPCPGPHKHSLCPDAHGAPARDRLGSRAAVVLPPGVAVSARRDAPGEPSPVWGSARRRSSPARISPSRRECPSPQRMVRSSGTGAHDFPRRSSCLFCTWSRGVLPWAEVRTRAGAPGAHVCVCLGEAGLPLPVVWLGLWGEPGCTRSGLQGRRRSPPGGGSDHTRTAGCGRAGLPAWWCWGGAPARAGLRPWTRLGNPGCRLWGEDRAGLRVPAVMAAGLHVGSRGDLLGVLGCPLRGRSTG